MSDIRIIYHGTPLNECSNDEKRELYNAFVTAYYSELKHDPCQNRILFCNRASFRATLPSAASFGVWRVN